MPKGRSFFEKLTGAIRMADPEEFEEEAEDGKADEQAAGPTTDGKEAQLAVDVYQTPNEIVIKTMVAGVRPEDLDVAITRDMVTLKGKREEERSVAGEDYFHRELYWGAFSRSILLPQEIDIEEAEAVEKHGLLIIRLPKLDKNRQARLKIKNS